MNEYCSILSDTLQWSDIIFTFTFTNNIISTQINVLSMLFTFKIILFNIIDLIDRLIIKHNITIK